MSIQFGDILRHNNPNYPIADVSDIRGGLRSIATFSGDSLISEYTSGDGGSIIPEKYKSGYSLLLETSTGTIYYYSGIDPTNVNHWTSIGIGGNGVTNTIPKWISPSKLGNSSITDNGDTVVISSNLMVIGTTSTLNTENLLVKDPIILLAGSQSGTPMFDAGLFVNRGSSDTQAFIWDESEKEFKFISTTSSATTSGNVSIGTYSSVRTGVLKVGTSDVDSNDRFIVSSSGGTVSLVVDENGYVYNRGRGGITTNTAFGLMTLGLNTTGSRNTAFGASALSLNTTGSYNTALGYQSLVHLKTGSRNVAIGSGAGSYYGYMDDTNDSIYIGYNANSVNFDVSNEIVIGATAIGNGSNSVTLGNDSITKTILKGNIGLGTASPSTKLHIFATQSGAFRLEDGTQSYPGYVLTSDANGVGTWQGNTQVTITSATATALPSWNNTTIMCNRSGPSIITIPATGLPPNFSFRFIVISSNTSATIAFTYSSPVSILPNTLLTFAQYESGVIDRYGATQNYYITY